MSDFKLPDTFQRSKRSPLVEELEFIHNFISKYNFENPSVLEFGGGITTWTISNALESWSSYCCVETYMPQVEQIEKHLTEIKCVQNWNDIPQIPYNLVFVDSSSGSPKDLKSVREGGIVFRDDAVNYVLPFVSEEAVFIFHDWCYKKEWQYAWRFLESKGYKLIDSYKSKFGVGVFRK